MPTNAFSLSVYACVYAVFLVSYTNEKQKGKTIMTKKKKQQEELNILDQLLDDENVDPVYLYDENKNKVAFEKVAVINLSGALYFLLSPLDYLDDLSNDEALVFKVVETKDGDELLVVEEDEKIVEKVFDEYYQLLNDVE